MLEIPKERSEEIMNIKQAEALTGVTRQNIRFYEKQGLLAPARNKENDYREYSQEDIKTLKWIRAMRMLDMPLEDIRRVLSGHLELSQAAKEQQTRLESQMEKLEGAIRFCGTLQRSGNLDAMDVDDCLAKMDAAGEEGYFRQWKLDYLAVCAAEHQRVFTFTPEEAITTPAEFTDALLAYARQENLDLVITQEGMYPTFTIDGIEYTAYRDYHRVGGRGISVPVATVHCEMTHPEDYLPTVSEKRRKGIAIFNALLPGIALYGFILLTIAPGLLRGKDPLWKVIVLLASIGVLIGVGCYFNWRFHFNEKGK